MKEKNIFLSFLVIVLSFVLFVSCPEAEMPPEPEPVPQNTGENTQQGGSPSVSLKTGTIRLSVTGDSEITDETKFAVRFNKTDCFEPVENSYKDKSEFYGATKEFVCFPTEYFVTVEYEDSSHIRKTACKLVEIIENSVTELSIPLSDFAVSKRISGYVFIDTPPGASDNTPGNTTPDNEKNKGLKLFLAGTAYYAETDTSGNFSFSVPEVSDNILIVKSDDSYLVLDNATKKAYSYIVPQNDIENADIVFSGSFSDSPEEGFDNQVYYNTTDKQLYCYSNNMWQEFKSREHEHTFFFNGTEFDDKLHYYSTTCFCNYCVKFDEHNLFDDGEIILQPTCISDGSKKIKCSRCSYYTTESIEKTGIHDYQFKEYETEPTCTEAGKEIRKCSVCGDEKIFDVIATGHNMVDGVCTKCSYREQTKNDVLSGFFSVSENLQVQFSKGNLYCSDSQWGFENNQYDYRMLPGETAFINAVVTTTKENDYGFFHWSKSIEEAIDSNYISSDYSLNRSIDDVFFAQNNSTIGSEWRNLTKEEMEYLFSRKKSAYNYMFGPATLTVNSSEIKGLILLPDGWQEPDDISFNYYTNEAVDKDFSLNLFSEQQWEILESSGCVFLPAVLQDSDGKDYLFLWTASPQTSAYFDTYISDFRDYAFFFSYFYDSPYHYMGNGVEERFFTFPVRLVKEVN